MLVQESKQEAKKKGELNDAAQKTIGTWVRLNRTLPEGTQRLRRTRKKVARQVSLVLMRDNNGYALSGLRAPGGQSIEFRGPEVANVRDVHMSEWMDDPRVASLGCWIATKQRGVRF